MVQSSRLEKTILDPDSGYMSHPAVVSGPYTLRSWDGTTAEIPLSDTVGPRKTLVKVMELASAGDTIYAAEGNYDYGEILADGNTTSNRVIVKAGVLLAASGRRTSTFISGRYRLVILRATT